MSLNNWSQPRLTIAKTYRENDFGYVFRTTRLLVDFLSYSGFNTKDLRSKKILDFGCGTGTFARMLAFTGAKVYGYDPTPECIVEALVIEAELIPTTQLTPRVLTSDWQQIGNNFNLVTCVDVLPYLDAQQHQMAMDRIVNSLKEGGACYLWVNKNTTVLPISNPEDMQRYPSDIVIVEGVKQDGKIRSFRKCFK